MREATSDDDGTAVPLDDAVRADEDGEGLGSEVLIHLFCVQQGLLPQ